MKNRKEWWKKNQVFFLDRTDRFTDGRVSVRISM